MGNDNRELIYLHLNASERFVLSGGISFLDFYYSLPGPLQSLLLLKHSYKDADFNMNTMLEYVDSSDVPKFVQSAGEQRGELCWIDFEDESALSALEGQQVAELLYLSHSKQHLRPPFYRILNNEYVYLSNDQGNFNKMYFRSNSLFFNLLGGLIPEKMSHLKIEKSWLGLRRKNDYPVIPNEALLKLAPFMSEGVVISFEKAQQSRSRIEIPVYIIGDCIDTEEVADQYQQNNQKEPEAKLLYLRKPKEWTLVVK